MRLSTDKTMNTSSPNLVQQLNRQLVFLRNSVAAYDAGHIEEAVRIGVVIRVLCHDTNRSISLLHNMGRKATVKLVSTAKAMPSYLHGTVDFAELMAGMTFSNTLAYNPVPENSPTITCPDWWSQPVFVRDRTTYTRKDVVLSAANKDGGAHVDAPDETLQAFRESFWVKTVTNADSTKTTAPLDNNHFRMLRRFADELLKSQELLKLAA